MLKFINSLATIEINKEVDAVQLAFRSSGSLSQYSEVLSMAVSFANMHHISSYLLIKEQFDDMSSIHFHALVQNRMLLIKERVAGERAAKIKVAMLVNAEACADMANLIQSEPCIRCCTHYPEVLHFLSSSAIYEEKSIAR